MLQVQRKPCGWGLSLVSFLSFCLCVCVCFWAYYQPGLTYSTISLLCSWPQTPLTIFLCWNWCSFGSLYENLIGLHVPESQRLLLLLLHSAPSFQLWRSLRNSPFCLQIPTQSFLLLFFSSAHLFYCQLSNFSPFLYGIKLWIRNLLLVSVIVLSLIICVFFSLRSFISSSIIGVRRVCDANLTQLSADEITHRKLFIYNLQSILRGP